MSIHYTQSYSRQFFIQSPKAHYHVDSKQQKLNVLLVSNNPIPRYVEAYALAESGCIVTQVTDSKDVAKLLMNYEYQAVFMDWLPHNSSLPLIKQIQTLKPSLPLIAIANNTDMKNQAETAGVTVCLMRPFLKDECREILNKIRRNNQFNSYEFNQ
jgi:CheY-like chemotaxis protein